MRLLIAALVFLPVSVTALEVTAGSSTADLQHVKRVVNEQILGLTAMVEVLAGKLKQATDGLVNAQWKLDEVGRCARENRLYDVANNTCRDIAVAAPAPAATYSIWQSPQYWSGYRDFNPKTHDLGVHKFCALSTVVVDQRGQCYVYKSGDRWTLRVQTWSPGYQAYCRAACFD